MLDGGLSLCGGGPPSALSIECSGAFRVGGRAPIAQLAEAADLKSAKCRFEPDWGYSRMAGDGDAAGLGLRAILTSQSHTSRYLLCAIDLIWCSVESEFVTHKYPP